MPTVSRKGFQMTRNDAARVSGRGIGLALLMRGALSLLAQALVAGLFRRRGRPDSWNAAAAWWMVHSTLADLGCLFVLHLLLRREGLALRDQLGFNRRRPGSDVKTGLVGVAVAGVAGGVSTALSRPFYGSDVPPLISVVRVPWWARVYGIVVWPAIWSVTEELVYLGYALPRLEARLGSTKRAAALVIACWGPLQHLALPALPDRRYLAYRAVTATPPVAIMTAFFLASGRRLPPLILAHWVADLATGVLVAVQHRATKR
jgi:membrane protease YdiL (CAAX protease family)